MSPMAGVDGFLFASKTVYSTAGNAEYACSIRKNKEKAVDTYTNGTH